MCELETHVLIIEVDENGHLLSGYSEKGEESRMKEISEDLKKDVIFLRFNPDSYINDTGEEIRSCFGYNNKYKIELNKEMTNEWEKRIEILLNKTNYWLNNKPNKKIEVEKLFF